MQSPDKRVKFDTRADTIQDIHGKRVQSEDSSSQLEESHPQGVHFKSNADEIEKRYTQTPSTQEQSNSDTGVRRK